MGGYGTCYSALEFQARGGYTPGLYLDSQDDLQSLGKSKSLGPSTWLCFQGLTHQLTRNHWNVDLQAELKTFSTATGNSFTWNWSEST